MGDPSQAFVLRSREGIPVACVDCVLSSRTFSLWEAGPVTRRNIYIGGLRHGRGRDETTNLLRL